MSDNPSEGKTLRSGLKVIRKAITKRATIADLRNKSSSSLTTLKKSKLNESNDSIISCAGSQGSDDRKRKVPTAENTNIISNITPGGTQEAVAEFNDAESTYSVPSTPVPQAQPPSQPTNLVPDSQQSEAILSAVEAFDEMSDDISSGSTPKAAPQELVSVAPIPSQASSRGQSQPREEHPRRHFFHDCPDDVDPDDTWMLNAIEWLRLDFLLMEKLSRGCMKADKSTDDKQATNRIISKIEQVMTEGLQEMGQLSIQANQAFREAILADDIDNDVEEIPTSQPLTEGYIDIDMEPIKNPIIDYKDFVAPPTPQSHSKTAHVPEHEVAPAHSQSEEQSMFTQIMSELKNVKATIQKQQASINRLENGEFSRPPRPTPSTTRPAPPPIPKTKQQAQKKPSVTFTPPPPHVQKSSSEPNTEPKPISYAKALANPSNKPKSDAGHIAAAIKKGASPKVLNENKGLRYLVRFSNLPHIHPDTPSLCTLLRDTLATNNKTLGGGRLINSSWSFKGNLTLIFSKNTPAKAIDTIIPLLMNAIEAPMTMFGIEKKWYRIVIPKCPTGLTIPGCTQAYSKGELLQITREAFSHVKGANFDSIKLTLMPNWITDPLLIQAQNRPTSAIAFSFEDPGQKVSERLLSKPNIIIEGVQTTIKQFVPKPILTACLKCAKYGHLTNNCRSKIHRCTRCGQNHPTSKHNAVKCKGCRLEGNNTETHECICVWCASCRVKGHLFNTPQCPKTTEFRHPITSILTRSDETL